MKSGYLLSLLLLSLSLFANNFQPNQRVEPIGVTDRGELNYQDNKFTYSPWNSAQLIGKVRIVQHMAGRTSAKELNEPLIAAITEANFPRDKYQTTTIVNVDDAIVGTSFFVRSSIESSKKEFPWSQVIVDNSGLVKKAWDLQPQSSAIVVLNSQGQIQFSKEGALTPEEIRQVMTLVNDLIG